MSQSTPCQTLPSRTNVVLAINPLHQKEIESYFWREFAYYCHQNNMHLVQIAMRNIPSVKYAQTLVLPQPIVRFAAMKDRFPEERQQFPAPWLSNDWGGTHGRVGAFAGTYAGA